MTFVRRAQCLDQPQRAKSAVPPVGLEPTLRGF